MCSSWRSTCASCSLLVLCASSFRRRKLPAVRRVLRTGASGGSGGMLCVGVSPRRAGFWGSALGEVRGGVVRPTGDVSGSCAALPFHNVHAGRHAAMHHACSSMRAGSLPSHACTQRHSWETKLTIAGTLPMEAACGEKGLWRPADAGYCGDSV